jgi:Domain of unknown function (DUF4399)
MKPMPIVLAMAMLPCLALAQTQTQTVTMPGMSHDAPAGAMTGSRHVAPPNAYCYIGWPNDGETIRAKRFKVWFGTRNFGVAPAGSDIPNTGHHHLLVDAPLPPLDEPIPNDKNHLHFGKGQTETFLELPPGTHTLQLLMGDENHVPHDPPVMSKKITIQVAY